MRRLQNAAAALLLALAAPFSAAADGPLDTSDPYRYQIIETDLADALRDLGTNLGFAVDVAPGISGRVVGPLPQGTAREFLDRLARQFGFTYVFDGRVLTVTPAAASETRLLSLGEIAFETLASTVEAFGVVGRDAVLTPSDDGSVALVSGPPRYVAVVADTLAALAQAAAGETGPAGGTPSLAAAAPAAEPQGAPLVVFRGAAVTIYPFGRPN